MKPKSSQSPALLITRFPLESGWGGEEKLHLELARALVQAGHPVLLWSSCPLWRRGFAGVAERIYGGFPVKDPTSTTALLLLPVVLPVLLLQALVLIPYLSFRGVRSVLMLSFVEKAVLTPFFLLCGFRVCWGHHARPGAWLFRNPLFFLWKLWSRYVTILVPSNTMARDLRAGAKNATIRVIPNAVPTLPVGRAGIRSRLNIPADSFVVGSTGRLSPEKRFDLVLGLAASLPEVIFVIAGDGPERERLQSLQSEYGLLNIHLPGMLSASEIGAFYGEIDLFISFSEYESFGLSLLEAQQSGVPVLAPKAGAIPEVVPHGVAGLLFEPGDIKVATVTIQKLMKDPELRKRLSDGARANASRYSFDSFFAAMKQALFSGD